MTRERAENLIRKYRTNIFCTNNDKAIARNQRAIKRVQRVIAKHFAHTDPVPIFKHWMLAGEY